MRSMNTMEAKWLVLDPVMNQHGERVFKIYPKPNLILFDTAKTTNNFLLSTFLIDFYKPAKILIFTQIFLYI
jgi:hypothetical protein